MKKFSLLALTLTLALGLAQEARAQATGGGTKIAVVNVGEVFQKYEKAKAFKGELEKIIGPRKAEAETLKKEILAWQEAIKHPKFDKKDLERYQAAIVANQRKLEDLSRTVSGEIGKVQEFQIVALYKDLNSAIEATAKHQGYQLILGYGDILTDPFTLENINRKMNGMDLGSTTPLFFGPGANLTEQVIQTLNHHFRSGPTGVVPTGGTVRPGM